ncbi:MAG: hypothetical protein ACO1OO_13050 [Flavisolibacter sp.]
MAETKKSADASKGKQKPYLTKRILAKATKAAVKKAAKKTMKVMGYSVVAQNGWIIRKYADGKIERISRIAQPNARGKIAVDQTK